jgi:CshA-type fibril repeat protein
MSIIAGKITAITGQVQAINSTTGEVRFLGLGDVIYQGEQLITSADGSVSVDLINGELLTLGRGTQMLVDDDVLGGAGSTLAAAGDTIDVEALQQALLAGDISIEDLEATAAGEAVVGSSSAGLQNVVERIGAQGDVTSGFDTSGFSTSVSDREFTPGEALEEGVQEVVPPANNPPVAADDVVTLEEDSSQVIDVLANDTDLDGDTLSVQAVTQPENGTVVINPDGTVTYTPNPDYNGEDSFTYTLVDGNGGTDTATVNINVTPVNDPPVVETVIADQVLPEDFTTYTLNLNEAFADIETADSNLVYSVSGNSNIGVSIENGIATISQSVADWNGSEVLTFTATDEGGLSASQTVNFTVTPVVDIAGESVEVAEDSSIIINVLGNDEFENENAEVTSVTDASNGTVTLNADGTVTYTPNSDYNGEDSFTYTVTSGGVTETATVNINVTPVNDPPVVENSIEDQEKTEDFDSYTIDLKEAFADIETSDANLVYSVTGNSNIGVSIDENGVATISQATADWHGSELLTFTATDEGGLSASQTVNFTVTPEVDIAGDSVNVEEDIATIIKVLDNDTFENENAEVTSVTDAAHGTVTLNDGVVTYTPDENYNGPDQFDYTVTSGGVTETATVNINVTPVNDAPIIESTIDDQLLSEDFIAYTINLNEAFADIETADSNLVYSVSGNSNIGVSIDENGIATISQAVADWHGSETLTFTATDEGQPDAIPLSVSQEVVFTVAPVADIVGDVVSIAEDTTTSIPVLENDSFENAAAIVTAVSDPEQGTVEISEDGKSVIYTPVPDYNGPDSFTYTVTSGGVTETATVNINVTPEYDGFTIPDQLLAEDFISYEIDLNAAFADVVDPQFSVSGNSNIGVSIVDGIATISQAIADWNGSENLTFTATSGQDATSETQEVVFTVTPVVDIAGDTISVSEESPITINMLGNDTFENENAEVTSVTDATHGTVTLNTDGTVTYTPDENYNGPDQFDYTVTSGGVTETATVSINVTPVNDPPVVETVIADQVLPEDFTTYTLNLNEAFADIETADSNLVYSVTGNSNIGVSIENGIATISQSVADWNGSEVLTFTATDEGGLSASQTVNFTVTPVVDIAGESVEVAEDSSIIINVLGNDEFENANAEVTSVTDASNGTVTLNADGTVTYTPDANYYGADQFDYTVTSGGVTETATVNINVTPVDDMPSVENLILSTDNLVGDWVAGAMPITLSEEGPNTLTWDLSEFPEIYSNGELVTVSVVNGVVVGSTETSGDTVFTLSVDLNESTADTPVFLFEQFAQMIAGTTIEISDSVDLKGGNTSVGYGFVLLDLDNNILATAQATGVGGNQDTVNTNNNTMGVGNAFIDSGETLTIDFTVDEGSFDVGQGGNAVTYDFVSSGVQGMLVTLDAFDTGETATYTVYGKDADGEDVTQTFTVSGDETGTLSFEISAEDLADAVYIDKVEFGVEGDSGSYQLSFDAITTVELDEDVSMDIGYTLTDGDGDTADATVTIHVSGEDDGALIYQGTDEELDVFDMGEPGSEVFISNYDMAEDVLNLSDVITDSDSEVAANTLSEYLSFSLVDADGDGLANDTQMQVYSSGKSDAASVVSTVIIQDTSLDETDIDDMNIDYQSQ